MRVTGITLTAVAVPYRPEVGTVVTAGLTLTEARHVLVEVHTDTGITGLGEAIPRPSVYGETLDGIRSVIETLLGPPLLGLAATDVERAWAAWARVVGNQSAKAALDVALHDAVARAAGIPLWRLLGGAAPDGSIPLTMALGIGTPASMAGAARDAVAEGYAAVKLKVGKDVRADLAAVAAVREAIGPDVLLYVDANGGYSRRDALTAIRGFERHRVALVEEPVAASDVDGRARLARATDIPLLLDESTNELAGAFREIASGTAGAISIRAARSGVTRTRDLVGIASATNVPLLVGSHRELGPGAAANAHLAAAWRSMAFPAELGSHLALEDSLLVEPLAIARGRLTLPTGPGLGVALDPARVERHRVWRATLGDAGG